MHAEDQAACLGHIRNCPRWAKPVEKLFPLGKLEIQPAQVEREQISGGLVKSKAKKFQDGGQLPQRLHAVE